MSDQLVSIGEFSRMTFLSVKTLRHYHEEGLLAPARIDPSSGYRFYEAGQVATAQLIRRFRELDLPVGRLREFLDAPDEAARNDVIVDHLDKMSAQLAETQATVESLKRMLSDGAEFPVAYRSEPDLSTLAIRTRVSGADVVAWWMESFRTLHRALAVSGATRSGLDGTMFPTEFFTDEVADLVAFVPVSTVPDRLPAGVTPYVVPAAHVAVTVFDGPAMDLDRAYGALGRRVLDRAIASDGPVRERYAPTGDPADLLAHSTEICWPVSGPSPEPHAERR